MDIICLMFTKNLQQVSIIILSVPRFFPDRIAVSSCFFFLRIVHMMMDLCKEDFSFPGMLVL